VFGILLWGKCDSKSEHCSIQKNKVEFNFNYLEETMKVYSVMESITEEETEPQNERMTSLGCSGRTALQRE
jgi:hypothetical protein